jgi:hypothetical protein
MTDGTSGAASVEYDVAFTPAGDASDVLLLMCTNASSPIVGDDCTATADGSFANATVSSGGTVDGSNKNATGIVIVSALTGESATTIKLTGVHNPTDSQFYIRIETFDTVGHAEAAYGDPTITTGMQDSGAVALATSSDIGVDAAVMESLSFCVYGDVGDSDGGGTTGNSADAAAYLAGLSAAGPGAGTVADGPGDSCATNSQSASVTLGQHVGPNQYALDTSNVSYAADWSQVNTNAAGGAIVYLKSANACSGGGLTIGSPSDTDPCGIPGITSGSITAGTPGFGVKIGTPATGDGSTTNDGTVTPDSDYTSNYFLGADTNGTYGDPVYSSDGPTQNWDVPMGVGASIGNFTAAGNYHDSLSLIATGTF